MGVVRQEGNQGTLRRSEAKFWEFSAASAPDGVRVRLVHAPLANLRMGFRRDIAEMNKRQQEADAKKAAKELGDLTNNF